MLDLNATPNPPGSPVEKLLTESMLDNSQPQLRAMLSDNPTKEELLKALFHLDDKVDSFLRRHARILEQWANIHTHPEAGGALVDPVLWIGAESSGWDSGVYATFAADFAADAEPLSSETVSTRPVEGVASTPDGQRIVLFRDEVVKLAADGSTVWGTAVTHRGRSLGVAPDGSVYVGTAQSFSSTGQVVKYDSDGTQEWSDTVSQTVNDIKVGPDGTVHAACQTQSQVLRYDPDGTSLTALILSESSPTCLSIDGDGTVFVGTDAGGGLGKVFAFVGGVTAATWTVATGEAVAVAAAGDGGVYAVDSSGNRRRLDSSGSAVWTVSPSPAAVSLAVDSLGTPYGVTDIQSRIQRYDPANGDIVASTVFLGQYDTSKPNSLAIIE